MDNIGIITKMKKIENKAVAVLIYLAPYIMAVIGVALYGLVLSLVRPQIANGYLIDQTNWESLLTYLPMVIALLVGAHCIKKIMLKKVDLSVIGVKSGESQIGFIPIAIIAVLFMVSLGFGLKTVGVKGNKISETGFLGVGKQVSTVSDKVKWQEKDNIYTVFLDKGKQYSIKEDSQAGQEIRKVLYGQN